MSCLSVAYKCYLYKFFNCKIKHSKEKVKKDFPKMYLFKITSFSLIKNFLFLILEQLFSCFTLLFDLKFLCFFEHYNRSLKRKWFYFYLNCFVISNWLLLQFFLFINHFFILNWAITFVTFIKNKTKNIKSIIYNSWI